MRQFKTIRVREEKPPVVITTSEKVAVLDIDPVTGVTSEEIVDRPVEATVNYPKIASGFLFAGRATLVAQNNKGDKHTIRITSAESEWPIGSGRKTTAYFVNIKAPGGKRWANGSQSPWRYIGLLNKQTGLIKTTQKSEFQKGDNLFDVCQWVLSAVFEAKQIPAGYDIDHAGKCGKCGRELTDPDSMKRGIGPDCWAQMGGTF